MYHRLASHLLSSRYWTSGHLSSTVNSGTTHMCPYAQFMQCWNQTRLLYMVGKYSELHLQLELGFWKLQICVSIIFLYVHAVEQFVEQIILLLFFCHFGNSSSNVFICCWILYSSTDLLGWTFANSHDYCSFVAGLGVKLCQVSLLVIPFEYLFSYSSSIV